MWKRALIIAAIAILTAVGLEGWLRRLPHESPVAAYLHTRDAAASILPLGIFNIYPCARLTSHSGVEVYERKPLDQCFKMQPQRRFQGVWLDQFEGSTFFQGATDFQAVRGRIRKSVNDGIRWNEWLSFAKETPDTQPSLKARLVAIDFIGRRTAYIGRYGHLGVSESEVIVDSVISMRPLYQSEFAYLECEFQRSSVSCE